MNTLRGVERIDAEVTAIRNPKTETVGAFHMRTMRLRQDQAGLVIGDVPERKPTTTTNHGSKVS